MALTGKHIAQTSKPQIYKFTRDGTKYMFVDTAGTYDNRDIGLSDQKILDELQEKIGMQPRDARIVFVLV